MEFALLFFYGFSLFIIFLYSLAQLQLVFYYLKAQKITSKEENLNLSTAEKIPFVTIQLPIYNERYVVERLLKNIVE